MDQILTKILAICLCFIYGLVPVTSLSLEGLEKPYRHNDTVLLGPTTVDRRYDQNVTANVTHVPVVSESL